MTTAADVTQLLAKRGPNLIVDDLVEDHYHGLDRLSYSGLKELRKAPGYYRWSKDNPSPDTEDRRKFRAMHMLLAEPERAAREIVIIDGRRVGAVKAELEAAEAAGKLVLKTEDHDQIMRVADFCRKHPIVSQFLKAGKGEQSILWTDPETGAECKARADWLTPGGIIVDWKGFDELYLDDIRRQMRKMRYVWQQFWYLRGLEAITGKNKNMFANVFIRTKYPIDCRVIAVRDEDVQAARDEILPLVAMYAKCVRDRSWPMTPAEITEISVSVF